MPRHLTYRSASSAGTTRDIWTDSLLNQICLLRRNPFKLDDPSTNVDSQIQPSAVNLLKAGQLDEARAWGTELASLLRA